MPYKSKELKSEYQKRTATPYMREWREKNRERHREYMREWGRNRRLNKEKHASDIAKMKETESYKRQCALSKYESRISTAGLADYYVVRLLVRHGGLTTKLVRQYPELIQIHKKIVLTKRLLKHDNHSNKQL